MGFLIGASNKMPGVKALAHQAALHVHQADQHGINVACGNLGFQIVKSQNTSHGAFSCSDRVLRRGPRRSRLV